jgi:hypothetical protein
MATFTTSDGVTMFFLQRGFRVIAHDRRGHGRSSHTPDGHDIDHYADDSPHWSNTSTCAMRFTSGIPPAEAILAMAADQAVRRRA